MTGTTMFTFFYFLILQAETNDDLKQVGNTSECGELLEHSGCTAMLTVSQSLCMHVC